MNGMPKSLGPLLAIALAVSALPAIAGPQKTYNLNVQAGPVGYNIDPQTGQSSVQVPVPVTAIIKNESPPSQANSNISSFTLTVSGMTIFAVDLKACQSRGANCALDTATNTVVVTNISPPLQQHGMFPVSLTVSSCGDGNWSAKVYSGSQTNGSTFGGPVGDPDLPTVTTTSVSCGDVACGESFSVLDANNSTPGSPTFVHGLRGAYDKDGSTCPGGLQYFVTNTIPTNSTLHFEWDAITEPTAAFRYVLNYPQPSTPQVAWRSDNLGPVFIAGQPCDPTNAVNNNLPTPYGVLSSDAAMNATKLKVDTTGFAATNPALQPSFAIVIGTERMKVTAITSGNWTVQRHQGGTTSPPKHLAGSLVMSTPLPLIDSGSFSNVPAELQRQTSAGYVAGNQAQVCVAAPDKSLWPASTFEVIDIGDAYLRGVFN